MKITLAIHTYRYAIKLKRTLEQGGVKVWLQDVNTGSESVSESKISAGVRVRILEDDLPQALRMIESGSFLNTSTESEQTLLVPVDFSRRGLKACLVAVRMALYLHRKITMLYVCSSPYFQGSLPETSQDSLQIDDSVEIEEVREAKVLKNNADVQMREYLGKLNEYCKQAGIRDLPEIITVVREGVPEEVISDYCSENAVYLVIMSTRDTRTRSSQLIGSVTAEVVDNARISVLVIPDAEHDVSAALFSKVLMFCNMDQADLILADSIVKLTYHSGPVQFVLMPINDMAASHKEEKIYKLAQALSERYPDCSFSYRMPPSSNFSDHIHNLVVNEGITLAAVANKRRNLLSRLFNPGLAHKMLFTSDIPLFALSNSDK